MSIFTRLALLVCALGAANAVDILVIGDSYAEYGKTYWASFCGATARNEGSGGTTSVQWANGDTMQDAFDTAPEAKHILYLIGGNDFMGAKCAPTRVEMKATVLKSLNILVAAVAAAGKGAEEREREEEEVEGEREAEPNCVCEVCVCVCGVMYPRCGNVAVAVECIKTDENRPNLVPLLLPQIRRSPCSATRCPQMCSPRQRANARVPRPPSWTTSTVPSRTRARR
jgi:hypothetical protein